MFLVGVVGEEEERSIPVQRERDRQKKGTRAMGRSGTN
jgi:hypothetical protein